MKKCVVVYMKLKLCLVGVYKFYIDFLGAVIYYCYYIL